MCSLAEEETGDQRGPRYEQALLRWRQADGECGWALKYDVGIGYGRLLAGVPMVCLGPRSVTCEAKVEEKEFREVGVGESWMAAHS